MMPPGKPKLLEIPNPFPVLDGRVLLMCPEYSVTYVSERTNGQLLHFP